ncbi:MAG: DUF1926 domain-containing protein [Planctomycetes bacterium]|nr:DUF1926 domain-containing protein [Planctomycetota bacterium]
MTSVRLVLAIHNHQPIGNFGGVFEAAYGDSYAPFLDVLADYPELPISLHISGSLLEWLVEHRPQYVDRVREFVERGQIEIIGGAFFEPILACIPHRDRVGQIQAYSQYLERTFGGKVRGMWVPERVWEQAFASAIVDAGIEYTVLDDYHFRCAGLADDELHGYYLTEDEGRVLKVFPGSERLRYTIPFQQPEKTIEYMRELGNRFPGAVAVFGDDGEKFGTWPETKKHVYEDGWLRRFLDALRNNADWLKVTTLAEAVDNISPAGRIYLPDASYREMTEWALPPVRQTQFHNLVERKKPTDEWQELRQFLRGGVWRNFRAKYPESNEMYSRMLAVSRRLEALETGREEAQRPELLPQARTELYRGQCNCSYWHGAFGGLYLPHLRNAVYHHLLAADNLLEQASGRSGHWLSVDAADYDLDARKELRLASDRLVAWLAPVHGGHLYELDIRAIAHNLLATLDRRPEAYHDVVRKAGGGGHGGNGEPHSIHESVRFKQPDLDKQIVYDRWRRKSLVDHFFEPELELDDFRRGDGEIGDFVDGVYQSRLRRSDDRIEAVLSRRGRVGNHELRLTKTVALSVERPGTLEIRYVLEDVPAGVPLHFGVEFNFAGMAAGAPDRYYYDASGRRLGQLESVHSLQSVERLGLVDEWLGLDASLEISQPADMWTLPIQTISQSEGGFELVHQSSAVVPRWTIHSPADGRWEVSIALSLDTSAARARQLAEAAAMAAAHAD